MSAGTAHLLRDGVEQTSGLASDGAGRAAWTGTDTAGTTAASAPSPPLWIRVRSCSPISPSGSPSPPSASQRGPSMATSM